MNVDIDLTPQDWDRPLIAGPAGGDNSWSQLNADLAMRGEATYISTGHGFGKQYAALKAAETSELAVIDEMAGWDADEDGELYDASEQEAAEAGPKPAPLYKPPVRITTEAELTSHLEHHYGRPANRTSRRAASKKVAREIVRLRRSNYYT